MLRRFSLLLLFLAFTAPAQLHPAGFSWQFSAGIWSLEPLTSPLEREAEQMVQAEAQRFLAPLLSEFLAFNYQPEISIRSHGAFLSAAGWLNLGRGEFALGIGASLVDFTMPFTLKSEQDVYLLGRPIARVGTNAEGRVRLRSLLLSALGRWRIHHGRRIDLFASLGLSLLPFRGDFHLPLTITVDSLFGTVEITKTENKTISQLRSEHSSIPAFIISPILGFSLHYRLARTMQVFVAAHLSSGTFLSAGLAFGR